MWYWILCKATEHAAIDVGLHVCKNLVARQFDKFWKRFSEELMRSLTTVVEELMRPLMRPLTTFVTASVYVAALVGLLGVAAFFSKKPI